MASRRLIAWEMRGEKCSATSIFFKGYLIAPRLRRRTLLILRRRIDTIDGIKDRETSPLKTYGVALYGPRPRSIV
jgi:hypothetical protein